MIIGLGHRKRTGKDTVANYLEEKWGARVLSFASPLKELVDLMLLNKDGIMATVVFQQQFSAWADKYGMDKTSSVYHTIRNIDGIPLDLFTMEDGKPRKLLQYIGTDLIRNQLGKDFWIEALKQQLKRIPSKEWVVVTDVRFPNEKQFIEQVGIAVKVDRKTELNDTYESELALADANWSYIINNNSTLENLFLQVEDLVSSLLFKQSEAALPLAGIS